METVSMKKFIFCIDKVNNANMSMSEAVEAHTVVRRRSSHIFSRQSVHRWR
jgi:hypothetical protein